MNYLNASAVLAFVMLLVACKPEPSTDQIDYKRTENSVAVRLEADVANLNPLVSKTGYESQVIWQLYTYPCSFDYETLEFIPETLKELPVIEETTASGAPGKYAIRAEILEEAVWSDGTPVTAADYLFTIKAMLNPLVDAARYRVVFNTLDLSAITLDEERPKQFTVYLNSTSILDLETLFNLLPILPRHIMDSEGWLAEIALADLMDTERADVLATSDENLQAFAQQLADPEFARDIAKLTGSGPYEIVDWVTGQRVTLQRKNNWWGDQVSKETHPSLVAYPEELVYRPIDDPTAALAALKSEEIDVMNRIPESEFEALKEDSVAGERYQLEAISSMAVYYYSFNTDNPKLADPRVRQAIANAADIDEILQTVYLGYGERTASPVLPSQAYYNEELPIIRQDIEKAKQLLAEAGWEDTNNNGIVDKEIEGEQMELSIEVLTSQTENSRNTALLLKDQLEQAGIDLQPKAVTGTVLLTNLRNKEYEVASVGSSVTPVWHPGQSWYSQGGSNRTGFGTAKSDAMIDEILVTFDLEKRKELYEDLQQEIYEQQPVLFLYVPQTTVAVHNRFEAPLTNIFPCYDPRYFKLKEAFQEL
ncbi:MAG TPA: ABC transporter substrate-binding protein [Saprospiraceae bacterium]|nr:ABC transporter substrate-binding protein [Saprospiraceae bacterium]